MSSADYTTESFAAMQTALEAARTTDALASATQEAVDSTTRTLCSAIEGLQKIEIPVTADKTQLKAAMADAERISGTEYTAESFAAMQTALESARTTDALASTSQEAVDSATRALRSAIEGLKKADVTIEVTEIKLNLSEVTLTVGESVSIIASVLPENAAYPVLTWSSSDMQTATVENGTVTAWKEGSVVISVATPNGKTASCNVKVEAKTEENNLADVPEGWMLEPVKYVYARGIMTGKGIDVNGKIKFAPVDTLSREEFAQILYAAEGKPEIAYTDRFSDVTDGNWYTKAILWAAERGIVSGYSNGKFGVGDRITREQLAAMLYKYAEYKGYDTTGRQDLMKFTDNTQISGWAGTQLQWAVANGVISGKGSGENVKLDAFGNATRAECAAMLRTFITKFES